MEEEQCYLEDQFILRLPRQEADYIRTILATKPKKLKKRLQITLDPESQQGHVRVKKRSLPGRLRKLPTVIESLKTHDRVVFVKTADICQIFDCLNPEGPSEISGGLAPPLKNCKRRRFRKGLVNKDEASVNVQKELFYLLQADLEAVATRFEIIYEENKEQKQSLGVSERYEIELFGNVLTDSEETDSNGEEEFS